VILVRRFLSVLALCLPIAAPALYAQWTPPAAEELSMTSIPQAPGASAVYLFKEEIADDGLHMQSFYYRIKILTDGGKDLANVELPFVAGESGFTIDSIAGRTIHTDGTIIPFSGKPYEKVVEKVQGFKIKEKVFSLPAVEVGSIIEYRYALRLDDHYFRRPEWNVQTDLYTRKVHYMWRPTDRVLSIEDGKQVTSGVMWTPILPVGAQIKKTDVQLKHGIDAGSIQLDLDMQDIPALPKEQFMPPMQSFAYRVMFYYSPYQSMKEFWTDEGKRWSRDRNKFIGPGSGIKGAVGSLVAPTDTADQKLRKIYAAVMEIENTDFSRERSTSEERADGLKDVHSADDILARKRGSGEQITEVFVAMARAAGLKAYVMGVANRDERIFLPSYLSLSQIDDYIAIVNVDGKDMYLDPGERYCAFGKLSWKHSFTGGLRQTDAGTEVIDTPLLNYKDEHVTRIADLKLDDHGVATGPVTLTDTGNAALRWRQQALRGDETSIKEDLRVRLEHLLPGGMDIKVTKIENLTAYEQPLKVTYDVTGSIGSPTGKRLLIGGDLFETNTKPRFPEQKRELPVDLHYPTSAQDAVRLTLPTSMVIESAPTTGKVEMSGTAVYDTTVSTTPTTILIRRNLAFGATLLAPKDYADLRDFYQKIEAKDQEPVVLTRSGAAAPKSGSGGN